MARERVSDRLGPWPINSAGEGKEFADKVDLRHRGDDDDCTLDDGPILNVAEREREIN